MLKRYKDHTSKPHGRTRKANWIKSLRAVGQQPLMVELEYVPPGGDWEAAERYWIAYYRGLGFDLTNHTDGGEGASGAVRSDETRRKIAESHVGIRPNAETRVKLSESHRGRKASDETRRKISRALSGRIVSAETKAKLSIATRSRKRPEGFTFAGRQHSDETKAKLREASLGHKHSEETRKKMSQSRRGKSPTPEAIQARREGIRRSWERRRAARQDAEKSA